jgi:hypothetical protein
MSKFPGKKSANDAFFSTGKKCTISAGKADIFQVTENFVGSAGHLERHSTTLGISYRHLRHGKRDYPN